MTASRGNAQRSGPIWTTVLGATCMVLGAWALGSGYYIAFHDRIVASVLGRQAAMQYAYEDRIAVLQAALDAGGSRNDRDDEAQAARWRALELRSSRLEASAARLETMLAEGRSPGVAPSGDPRPVGDDIRRSDAGDSSTDRRLALVEARQHHAILVWSDQVRKRSARLRVAMVELGLVTAGERQASGTGGPFVPLPADAATPETDLDGLRDDLLQRKQLERAAARLPLLQPVEGRLDVTSGYGARRDPFLGRLALHTGIDLREGYGGTVQAAAAGTVTIAGSENGYGTMVEIDHGNGYTTRYAHLSSTMATVGQRVAAGDMIGRIGTTGRSTGPHLHYEIRIAGEPIDPARYLALAAMIAGR